MESIALTTAQGDSEPEMVELFTINDRAYVVPAKPRASVGLRYLRTLRKGDAQMAQAQILADVLGEENYDALCDVDDLTPEQLNKIVEAAVLLAMGPPENSAPNQGN